MPAPGDQHNNAPANPFEEVKPRISEYTARELALLQGRLQQQLGPEFISTRKGPGGKNVHYIASDKVIGLANDVFGFNGWSSAIRDIQVDFVDENVQTKRVDVGLSVIIRVTLRDGTFHEDIGYGHIENCSGKAAAFEKAKKEGTTDALKRALRNFGNVLGNCVYDKEYLAKVTKIRVRPTKFSEEALHRHADYITPKTEDPQDEAPKPTTAVPANQSADRSESATINNDEADEFASVDFDEADFSFSELDNPDAMIVETKRPTETLKPHNTAQNGAKATTLPTTNRPHPIPPTRPSNPQDQLRQQSHPRPPPGTHTHHNQASGSRPNGPGPMARPGNPRTGSAPMPMQNGARPGPANPPQQRPAVNGPQHASFQDQRTNTNYGPPHPGQPPGPPPGETPIPAIAPAGFVTGRSAEKAQKADGAIPAFNPHAESPSIRRTAGFDHTKTSSVKRTSVPWTSSTGPLPQGPNGPQADMAARRIGAPVQHNSPLSNRGQFKPVGKRPAEGEAPQSPRQSGQSNPSQSLRQALSEVTPAAVNAGPTSGSGPPDPKKPRLESAGGHNENATAPNGGMVK